MPFLLKICGGTWENASRDERELSVYQELGYEVRVLAKGKIGDKGKIENVDGFLVHRYSTRPLGTRFPNMFNRIVSIFIWTRFVRKLDPDVISGHDLLPGLLIAWLSTINKKKKPKLIYDAHEFELGRNTNRNSLSLWLTKIVEGFLVEKCQFTIVVNDSIAKEMNRVYSPQKPIIVVRSTPRYNKLNLDLCQKRRSELLRSIQSTAGGKTSDPFLVMYHGSLTKNRGIEQLIRLLTVNDNIVAIILGNGSVEYEYYLHKLATNLSVNSRIVFHKAVSISQLLEYVGAVDLSLMMISDKAKSYYFALPNKFFESIHALTPIVASNFPEMKTIIDKYGIGLTCNPNDSRSINKCVEQMRLDNQFYIKCKLNTELAKQDLCWDRERHVLIDACKKYLV